MDPTAHQVMALNNGADLQGFREALRLLIWSSIPPEQAHFTTFENPDLFGDQPPSVYGVAGKPLILPRMVSDLIKQVICHSSEEKYALLYQLIWRMKRPQNPEPHLPAVLTDPLVKRLHDMAKAVKRDIHKMHAFVRFREVNDPAVGERFVAWFEPDHYIVEAAAQFFVDRFPSLDWTILTPRGSLWWDKNELAVGPAGKRADAPEADAFELGWRTYYESTFNPARTNMAETRRHMAKKYWRNLPETQAIPGLVQNASSRVEQMMSNGIVMPAKRAPVKAVEALIDRGPKTLAELNEVISKSEPFVEGSDKAVLGEGPLHPSLAFVGEQPGDQEDLQGRPFVGPAGQLFDRALEEAGIDRKKTYITNAVKHFKFNQRGKRRIHQSPTAGEIKHYKWWLDRELGFVKPKLIVTLGASAAHAVGGKAVTISRERGPHEFDVMKGKPGYITVHPSYLLRIPNEEDRKQAYKDFVLDLKRAKAIAG
jgi:DNA polymerase